MSLSMDEANRVVSAALAKAKEMNVRVAVAVIDVGGNLIAFNRMDGAAPSTAIVAQGKAHSSAMFGRTSGDVQQRVQSGSAPTTTVMATAGGVFVPWQGAVPIWRNDILEGACGVSGAASDQDEECARAGVTSVPGLK